MAATLCIITGIVTILGSIGLSFLRSPQWHGTNWQETPRSKTLAVWARFQKGIRRTINVLMAIVGCGVVAGAFVEEGRAKLALWLFIFLGLLTILFLAALDAVASMVGYRQAVPENARQTLSPYEPHP